MAYFWGHVLPVWGVGVVKFVFDLAPRAIPQQKMLENVWSAANGGLRDVGKSAEKAEKGTLHTENIHLRMIFLPGYNQNINYIKVTIS